MARLTSALMVMVLIGLSGCRSRSSWFRPRSESEPAYTILCLEAGDPARVRNSEALAQMLRDVNGLDADAVELVHDRDVSRVYYGQYRRRWDKNGVAQPEPAAQTMRDRIRSLSVGGQASYPFLMARIVPLPTETAETSPQWELASCPGVYTLQIGVFYDAPPDFTQRREAAEQAVELLRERGYEAWYHHGDARSTIFVGSFDDSAVIEGRDGRQVYSQAVLNLQQAEPDFQYNTHNGRIAYRTVAGQRTAETSFLIRVPRSGLWDR
jgi:hypothetical protein